MGYLVQVISPLIGLLLLGLFVWGALALIRCLGRALAAPEQSQDPQWLRFERRLRQLEQRIGALEQRLEQRSPPVQDQQGQQRVPTAPPGTAAALSASGQAGSGRAAPAGRDEVAASAPGRAEAHPSPPAPLPRASAQPPPTIDTRLPREPLSPLQPSEPPVWWVQLKGHWSENWTGILGIAAVVAGVTFVAIHLALRLDPFQRFLLVSLVAAGMASPSLLSHRDDRWHDLRDWLRSGGAALFLFACTASSGLPQLGLQWIASPGPGLALLSLGLALNLLAAAAARNQTVASLHVVLALIPLTISPQSWQTLLLASCVTVIGELLPGGRRWDRHRWLVGCCYGLFHVSWYLHNLEALAVEPFLRDSAGLLGLLVFIVAVLLDHRLLRLDAELRPLPLVLGLSNWGWLAMGLLIYPRQSAARAVALAFAAGTALLLARSCRRSPARWLQRSDRLLAQALAMGALYSLAPLLADPTLMVSLLLAECLVFLALAVLEGDALLRQVGWWLTALMATLLAMVGGASPADPMQASRLLILASLALALTASQLQRRRLQLGVPALLGQLAGVLVFIGAAMLPPPTSQVWISLAAMGGLLLLAVAWRPDGLRGAVSTAVVILQLRQWLDLLVHQPWPVLDLLGQLLPLLLLAALVIAVGRESWTPVAIPASPAFPATDSLLRALGLHLLGINLLLGSYLVAQPISPLAVGVAWLLLALLSLELADRVPQTEAPHVLAQGVLALSAFAACYLLVISQSPAYVQLAGLTLRGRLLIELFAIGVALYWWCFNGLHSLRRSQLWRQLHPWFLEACLIGIAVTILSEVSTLWRPVVWSLLALSLISQPLRALFAARLQVYAVVVHWVAVATLVTNLGTLSSPSGDWNQQPQTIALLAIAVQVVFLVASRRWLHPEDLRQPGGAPLLVWIGERVASRPHRWLDIPLFVAVAVYLAVRYDHALLTLLWALEAFVIYGLGAMLRDSSFRYLALAAMGACLLRLVSVDLAQADLGLRGLVFIGVGLLMLGMNTIYTRFWSDSR